MATPGTPTLQLDVANPHGLPLPPGAGALLGALFADYARVVVEGEFGGGFSGARVLTVTPYRDADTPELPTVVKLGPADLIAREFDAYRRHIRGRLSGIPEVWDEPVYVGGGPDAAGASDEAWGGLRYALVGAGLFDTVSLAHYAESAAPVDLAYVLEYRLFVHLGTIWRQSRLVVDAPLGPAYDAFLRPDLAGFFDGALGGAIDLAAPSVALPGRASSSGGAALALPNPLVDLPKLLAEPIPHRLATIHGDLNLENVLVDPAARTVRLIDFSHSREDHVLHDLLRLETGLVTWLLPRRLAEAGLGPAAVIALYRQLHAAADTEPPDPVLRTIFIGLIAVRKAAVTLLADAADWREYLVGLAACLVGAGKYRNLDEAAKAVAFWAAAAALDLAAARPAADLAALDRAIPVLLERNPVLDAYRRGRVAEWSGPRYELDERFVELSLLVDQGEESASGRWQAKEKRYPSLRALIEEAPDPALVILGAPGSGKSTLLRRLELEYALAGMEQVDQPLTFYIPLSRYKPARSGDPVASPRAWLAAAWSSRFPKLPPLDELLAGGRMILLLDALNEMPAASAAEARERVGAWKDFTQEIAAMARVSRVIFSCRSLDYSTPLSTPALRVPQVQVEPLSDEQVRRFLEQYAPKRAEGLWATLADSGHLDVVRSPYFLKLLAEQVAAAGEAPLGRAALFTGFVRQALVREVERDHPLFRADTLLTERDLHRLTAARGWRTPYELPERGVLVPKLGELAYRMQAQGEAEGEQAQVRVGYDEALALLDHARDVDIVSAGAALGVLDEDPGRDEVLYVHQLVQEYFAARALAKAPRPELVRAEWRAAKITPSVPEIVATLPRADELPALPRTGWEETTLLAVAMAADAEGFVGAIADVNLALAGRCAKQPEVRGRLSEAYLDALRGALVARSRDPEADLRDRIACGLAVGDLGDPRFERRTGPHGEYLLPPLVEVSGGEYPIGNEPFDEGGNMITDHVPLHLVPIETFRISRFLVTNAEYACFMAAGGYDDERWWATEAARAWRRGEGTAAGLHAEVRYQLGIFRAHPEYVEHYHESGSWDDKIYEEYQRRLAMTDDELEAYLQVILPGGRKTEPRRWRAERYNNPSQPVVGVSWYEARAYCAWLSAQTRQVFRLPTEVEWEAAARGMAGRLYAYGEEFDPVKGNTNKTRLKRPTPVGVFVEGDTPEGLADMGGNVVQWTLSLWGRDPDEAEHRYPYAASDGREDDTAAPAVSRVVRGGCFTYGMYLARADSRGGRSPDLLVDYVGFRVVAPAPVL